MLPVRIAERVINPNPRSQAIGAMTMGVGSALIEELAVDKRFGFFVNHDLAGYEVPVMSTSRIRKSSSAMKPTTRPIR